MERIIKSIEGSGATLREATAGQIKRIAYQMRRAGKRITENGVKKWYAEDDTARTNWLKQTKQALFGLFETTPAGFELVVTDLEIYIRELRRRKIGVKSGYALPHPIMSEVEKISLQIKSLAARIGDVCAMEATV